MKHRSNRTGASEGFSLIELIVSLVIITVGMLALAATTGYLVVQVQVSELRTKRATAVQQVVEELRATPFTQITARSEAEARQVGEFRVWWDVAQPEYHLRRVTIHSVGPGYNAGSGWTQARRDSFRTSLARLGTMN